MLTYTVRRVILVPITLILVSMIVFLMVRMVPGTVVDIIVAELSQTSIGGDIDRAAIEQRMGLDLPIHVQYGKWIWNIVAHGDFGTTLRGGTSVIDEVLVRMPVTFELGILSLLIGWSVSIPIGVYWRCGRIPLATMWAVL